MCYDAGGGHDQEDLHGVEGWTFGSRMAGILVGHKKASHENVVPLSGRGRREEE